MIRVSLTQRTLVALALCSASASLVASVLTTSPFSLTTSGLHVYGPVYLTDTRTAPQCFAFDNVNGYVYVAQVTQADGNGTAAQHAANGDLTITKLTNAGVKVGSAMHLTGFDHGMSMGVEVSGTDTYLWTGVDAQPSGGDGWGQKIARFKFAAGTTLDHNDTLTGFTKYLAPTDARATVAAITPAVDISHGRIAVEYITTASTAKYALFDLATVKAGGSTGLQGTPLATVSLASMPQKPTIPRLGYNANDPRDPATTDYTWQGWTTYGSNIYLLYGNQYEICPSPGNTELYKFSWNTANPTTWVQEATSTVFGSELHREPEGMAIQEVGADARLCYSFSTFVSSTNDDRQQCLAYKDLPSFQDTYESGTVGAVPPGYDAASTLATVSTTHAHGGTKSVRIFDNSSSAQAKLIKTNNTTTDQKALVFYAWFAAIQSACLIDLTGAGSTNPVFHVGIFPDGSVKYYNGSSWVLVAGAGTVATFASWNKLRLEGVNSANSVDLYVNDKLVGSASRWSTTATGINGFAIASGGTAPTGDDIYVDDLSLSPP